MRGYGEVPESKVQELNGVVGEMIAAAEKLNHYLAQGLGQDLQTRLERLERAGDEIGLLKRLERVINEHGLVEFRSALSMILDRLESKVFEIALFGRVSSGKSSLLNYIVQSDVLPVGVNPVTAVPTRLAYGPEPKLLVWFAHKSSEQVDIGRLPEFVTEQLNPANSQHVTRITVELLDRLGEDMQRYSLKHDALRRELATELEHQAHQIGLSRLVELRNIVAPWKVDSI